MKEILITSSVLILAVILLRMVFRNKVSRRLIYGAWLLVALRLLIPVQFGNLNFSVLNPAKPVMNSITDIAQRPISGPSREESYNDALRDYLSQGGPVFIPEVQEQVETQIQQGRPQQEVYDELLESNKPESIVLPEVNQEIELTVSKTIAPTVGQIAAAVWVAGMVAMAVWFAAVNLNFRRKLRKTAASLDLPESKVPVKVSSVLTSPCLFGLLKPTVYMTPCCVDDERMRHHVLIHELTHLHHGDHVWSWVRCICLCIYWFNPLVWVAASLSRRDCELACDEAVLKKLGEGERLAYGKTLLDMVSSVPAPGQLLETATAMHETKKQLKERMKCIVKKPKVFLTAAIILLVVLTAITGCTFSGAFDGPNGPSSGNTQPTTVPNTTMQSTISTTVPSTTTTPPTTIPNITTTITTPPTVPNTTIPSTPTIPADDPELNFFNELFSTEESSERSYYFWATGHTYASPTEISLVKYFDGGFDGEHEKTAAEYEGLKQLVSWTEWLDNADFNRLPKDKINAELEKVFGITLADLPDSAFEGLYYLESTDCYYFLQTGMTSNPMHSPFHTIEHNDDGTVALTYDLPGGTGKITLKPNGDDYLVVSNIHDPAII